MESPSNTHLLSAGAKCAHPHCGLHDYLPFKCQYCKDSFCSDHFRPSAHQCEKEVSNDRIAPPCPLCQTPVAIPIGQDPDSAMERHLNTACEMMGKKKSGSPRCTKMHCGKVLYAPIVCESCKGQFCAEHRHPGSHKCVVTSASRSSQASARMPSNPLAAIAFRFESPKKPGSSSSSSTRVSPTKAPTPVVAPKSLKAKGSSNPAPPPPAPTAGSSSTSHVHNPFSKTDRRARAELESKRKAMKERARKGLLSEREKQILAEEDALLAEAMAKDGKKDCIIM